MKRGKNFKAAAFIQALNAERAVVVVERKGDMKPDFIALCDRVDASGVKTDFILESERDYQALHRHFYRRDRRLIRVSLGESLWVAREFVGDGDKFESRLRERFQGSLAG